MTHAVPRAMLLVPLIAIPAAAQTPEWTSALPSPRFLHAMAYDSRRQVCVMFGGVAGLGRSSDTWELQGETWRRRSTQEPEPRVGHSMAYDSRRGVTVLFGGDVADVSGRNFVDDTWEWGGDRWQRRTVTGPKARAYHAMAFDSVRGVTVLFGGTGGAPLRDTWEWDGDRWTLRSQDGPLLDYPAMAFDRTCGRTVLFGRSRSRWGVGETWEWDGEKWEFQTDQGPYGRTYQLMAFDAARHVAVMIQESNLGAIVWEWDGSAWLFRGEERQLRGDWAAAAFDERSRRTVLFGGHWLGSSGNTWTWDGESWRKILVSPGMVKTMTVFDAARGETVLFDGADVNGRPLQKSRTWTWKGRTWTLRSETGPPGRTDSAMAYDDRRHVLTAYGGNGDWGRLEDTCEWNGSIWTQRNVLGPGPLAGHAMAYDSRRGETVLFGGVTQNSYSDETWEWNGQRWALRPKTSDPSPPPTLFHAMAFDSDRRVTVMFGGFVQGSPNPEEVVWEWDGAYWRRIAATGPGSGWRNPGLVYDTRRRTTLLFTGGGGTNDVWEWNGVVWKRIGATGTSPRWGFALAFDSIRNVSVLYFADYLLGGCETWEYGLFLPGDMNGDGRVSPDDLPPFVEASLSPGTIGSTQHRRADLDGSGTIDGEDVRLFVEEVLP